jgi:hypothetical protein
LITPPGATAEIGCVVMVPPGATAEMGCVLITPPGATAEMGWVVTVPPGATAEMGCVVMVRRTIGSVAAKAEVVDKVPLPIVTSDAATSVKVRERLTAIPLS